MNKKDKLIIKHKDVTVQEMVYLASTQTEYLFSKESDLIGSFEESPLGKYPESLIGVNQTAVLWTGDIGTTQFLPIKKKHNFVQLNENTWELDVDLIEKGDL